MRVCVRESENDDENPNNNNNLNKETEKLLCRPNFRPLENIEYIR